MTELTHAATSPLIDLDDLDGLAEESAALVRQWLEEAAEVPVGAAAGRLADMLRDPQGLAFTVGFIDGVVRPEDPNVAAARLVELAAQAPGFVPAHLRLGLRAGGLAARVAPRAVVPVVRRVLRSMVGHLLVTDTGRAHGRQLTRQLARLRAQGLRPNLNLLGEAVLGEHEAGRRLAGIERLLDRPDVDYVSVKVSATLAPHSPWAFDEVVSDVVRRLLPLYRRAAQASRPTFLNLDMEEYHDLDLTVAVFTALLDRPELHGLEAGIVLQAYLPDAMSAMVGLQEWAARRRAAGGAPVKVRLVKGANLPMERVDAELHGWPLATWSTKAETDANYKRVLAYALTPARIDAVRLGVAGHNLFDLAFAWLLAGRRGARAGMEVEMLLGMAPAQSEVVRRAVGDVVVYVPVVHPREFDVAIAYLVRRLEEGASTDNFISALFGLRDDASLFARERERFDRSLQLLATRPQLPPPHRVQNRTRQPEPFPGEGFRNAPDTDPATAANRAWMRAVLRRARCSTIGADLAAAHTLHDPTALDTLLERTAQAGADWGRRTGAQRAEVLRRAAELLERRRGELIEVMVSEAGKTAAEADPEVSEAVDFARYYAQSAQQLDRLDGARFVPAALTVVTPPWNFPVAIPAGSVLAALAAGSAAVLKPAPQVPRCGALVARALWDAGVPQEALVLANVDDGELGRRLVSHPRVDRVVLTGSYETAQLFRSFRPDLTLLAETSGKNAIVVTPSADLDLAVRDVVRSAFGHAGQKCSAASLVIMVGSVARSRRFRDQLRDAVRSLVVGAAWEPTTQVGPLVEPPSGKLLHALTTLEEGESWLVEPRPLGLEGRSWSPGVKDGVRPGSTTHRTEFFGPVLGLMVAADLDEAIRLQNEVDYGLTAGLFSLDRAEIEHWLERVEAGNLYVNRGTTGAIVRRQPFGGWKKSCIGAGFKAGGPHHLLGLGDWEGIPSGLPREPVEGEPAQLLADVATLWPVGPERELLERAFVADAVAWRDLLAPHDPERMAAEHDVLRHLPVPVEVRLAATAPAVHLVRVVGAALRAGAPLRVSTAAPLPAEVESALQRRGVRVETRPDAAWLAEVVHRAPARIRLLGGDPVAVATGLAARPEVALHRRAVTESGLLELLPFVREQAISATAHRFGSPDPLTAGLVQA